MCSAATTNDTFTSGLSASRDNGTDIVATVNGIAANGHRQHAVDQHRDARPAARRSTQAPSTDVNFTITGGGALFQLGPDVVSNQQARIGITSVNTARLGGVERQVVPARLGWHRRP